MELDFLLDLSVVRSFQALLPSGSFLDLVPESINFSDFVINSLDFFNV